ncbi:conserved hypothetical protein [Paecilomyces variotii No. 5]|uniref:Uncharacterized protein n=1 Tax=Byssochlamys spectabilis (strain No. 5 / NBRC 109023) TaxID=1356009 RepID=V5FLZ9_BYSSN|nr:conserved hypothetical protein [Paecilomyces variotii No. 5]
MDSSSEISHSQIDSAPVTTLQVDFTWSKFQARITQKDASEPLYFIDFHSVKAPHLVFRSSADGATIGTGTLHVVAIDAKYDVHGHKGTIKALKRFKTMYTHLSYAYSESETPVPMTWTSSCGFRSWDFICLDEQQMPVAKFSASTYTMKKIGNIDFMGPKAMSNAMRDEIVVTGITLFYCMVLRSTNFLSLVGAFFAKPGPIEDGASAKP